VQALARPAASAARCGDQDPWPRQDRTGQGLAGVGVDQAGPARLP